MQLNFYKTFGVFSAVIGIGILVLQLIMPQIIFLYTWFLYIYFVALTVISYWIFNKGMQAAEAMDFYNANMGATALRLLISAIILFGYYFNFKENKINFTFTFFVLYFLFTAFEIRILLSNLRQNKHKANKADEKK